LLNAPNGLVFGSGKKPTFWKCCCNWDGDNPEKPLIVEDGPTLGVNISTPSSQDSVLFVKE
jgi:hypothetical protein